MFTDTHCHVLSSEYSNHIKIISELEKEGIKRIIVNGYNLQSNREVIDLINKYDNVFGAIGIHPDNIYDNYYETISFINDNIDNKKIIAVGEIGLDYYHNKNNKEEQLKVFNELMVIAQKHAKPVIVHSREATMDVINTIKCYKCKGVIHSFSGSIETANEYIKLGYRLGINGIVTFKNSTLHEVIKNIPIKDLLIETDSPYLSPEPLRKYNNEPKNIKIIANRLAEIKRLDINTLADILEKNYLDTFDNIL